MQGYQLGVARLQTARQRSRQVQESPLKWGGQQLSQGMVKRRMAYEVADKWTPSKVVSHCKNRNAEPRSMSSGKAEEVLGAQQHSQADSLSSTSKRSCVSHRRKPAQPSPLRSLWKTASPT